MAGFYLEITMDSDTVVTLGMLCAIQENVVRAALAATQERRVRLPLTKTKNQGLTSGINISC